MTLTNWYSYWDKGVGHYTGYKPIHEGTAENGCNFVAHHMPMRKAWVRSICQGIEKKSPGKTWWESWALLATEKYYSEYMGYWVWVQNNHPGKLK